MRYPAAMYGLSTATVLLLGVLLCALPAPSLSAALSWSGGGWSQVSLYNAAPYCVTYNVYTSSDSHNVTFAATYYVQPGTNTTAMIVGYRILVYPGSYTISFQDLVPPASSTVNNVFYTGDDNSYGLPITTVMYAFYMREFGPGLNLNDFNGHNGGVESTPYGLRAGTCSDYSQSVWFYPQPALQSTCLSYTATSSDSTVTVTFTAVITFDGNRYTTFNNSNGIQFGFPIMSLSGTRHVTISSLSGSITTNVSLSYLSGSSLQPMMLQMQLSPYFYLLSFNASWFTAPEPSPLWNTSSPAFNGITYSITRNAYSRVTTGYTISNLRVSTANCAATAAAVPALPSSGLTAACVSGYWSDQTNVHGGANVVYQLTVLYNASNLTYSSTLGAYYTPIVDIQGTRTLWQSGVSSSQWVTLLPAGALRSASNVFVPASSTYIFDSHGVSFTTYPAAAGTTTNFTLYWSNAATYYAGTYYETGFLSGTLAYTPNQTCVTWSTDQANYYGNPQPMTYSFTFTVGNSSNRAVVAGTMTVDVGRLITSPVDARAMYRVLAVTGSRSTYSSVNWTWTLLTANASIALSSAALNLVYLPYTGFVSMNASTVLLDKNGLTYVAGGDTYIVASNGTAAYVKESDVAGRDTGFSGTLSLCMSGFSCPPPAFPLQLCLQYRTTNMQPALYASASSSYTNTTLLATITVNSSGSITTLQGTRFVQDGTTAGFTQMVDLLPAVLFVTVLDVRTTASHCRACLTSLLRVWRTPLTRTITRTARARCG